MALPEEKRLVGSLLIAGFDGSQLTSNICHLIEEEYIGAILITPKNLIDARQATKLIKDLQYTAYKAGHEHPLLIAIDQENGGCNSISGCDEISQFPSAMGVVAGNDPGRARAIGEATAKEMKCLGVNWLLGPVLDVVSKSGTNTLGVRMMDENPSTVAEFGSGFVGGYHEGGVATCGKHFPSYGNLQFDDVAANIPCVQDTLEELRQNAFIPYQDAIAKGIDSIMVGACSMPNIKHADLQHACLSETIVSDVLRQELGFPGVILCECLEVESLYESVGFGQAGIMALSAGCDMLMVCNSFTNQLETLGGVHAALASDILHKSQLQDSASRISKMKRQYTSWSTALNPGGAEGLLELAFQHRSLALSAYEASITVVRDTKSVLPLKADSNKGQCLLLLTPLLERISASHIYNSKKGNHERGGLDKHFMEGEQTFQHLGRLLAENWEGEVLHTSYAPSAVRPYHEKLIDKACTVIVVTADATRNSYQYGFAKYVGMLCNNDAPRPKQFVVVATSSPYDFLRESQISTYVCTYDYTDSALCALVKTLFGRVHPAGGDSFGAASISKATARNTSCVWLTQLWDAQKDIPEISEILMRCKENWPVCMDMTKDAAKSMLEGMAGNRDSTIFVVKNTSTKRIYGVCIALHIQCISRGSIPFIFVEPERRRLGIGQCLYKRAISHLIQQKNCLDIQLGSDIPDSILGISAEIENSQEARLPTNWLRKRGWETSAESHSIFLKIPTIEDCTSQFATNSFRWPSSVMQGDTCSQFDIVTHSSKCLGPYAHEISTLVRPEFVQELYHHATEPSANVDILIVRDSDSGVVVGSALLHGSNSSLSQYFFYLGSSGNLTGILIDPLVDSSDVLSSILFMGIKRCLYLKYPSLQCRLPANYLDLSVFSQGGFQLMGESVALHGKI